MAGERVPGERGWGLGSGAQPSGCWRGLLGARRGMCVWDPGWTGADIVVYTRSRKTSVHKQSLEVLIPG